MRVAISGASGNVGRMLTEALEGRGDAVTRLVRREPRPGAPEVLWDPVVRKVDSAGLEGHEAVVHLAGEPLDRGRWTDEIKARIRASRVAGTRLLSQALGGLESKPSVLVSASAMGYYGSRDDLVLEEDAPPGEGFLAELGQEWEAATDPAAEARIRVVNTRFGLMISRDAAIIRNQLTVFKLGFGGRVGDGRQFMPWVALDDVVGAIIHIIDHPEISGPVNVNAPNPVRNSEFAKALGDVLGRPTLGWMPAFGARLMFGEVADELLLPSQRMRPAKLIDTGYQFRFTRVEDLLKRELGRS